ncbi:TetR/AcrR family transcriptional regulator [Paraconexibacter sp.]|uniref:TetR/AcrR family transcriptional regulator n=1 Tax=Paraconexibacter sp. TaxID=2949640 RepID=UPI0035654943
MSRPTGRRVDREQRRVELALQILRATDHLTEDDASFPSVGVERLASAAGIGRSTFYLYFQDKTELLEVCFGPIGAELHEATARWTAIDTAPTSDQMRDVLGGMAAVWRSHATELSVIFDATSYDPIIREVVEAATAVSVTQLTKHIRAGQREGWVVPDVPPRETATWLIWMGQRGGHQLLRLEDEELLAQFVDGYRDVVWRSLYALAPGP